MRAGLLVNPRAGKSSGKGLALVDKLRSDKTISVKVLERFEQLPQFLDDLASEGVTDLFISSGDGTIHAIQSELAERRPFATLPRLSLLSHGTTNLTAADLGFRQRNIQAQADFIKTLQPTDLRHRPTVRAVNPKDGKPRHGMILGAGAVSEATYFCQQAYNDKGFKGNPAILATLAGAVAKALFTTARAGDNTRFDRPYEISVDADGRPVATGQQLFYFSTTLEKLALGTRPFWGGKTGAIRSTIIAYPPPSIARWLIPVMYGSETRKSPANAISFCSADLAVRTSARIVIDGEFFDAPATEALRVETGPVFTYICG